MPRLYGASGYSPAKRYTDDDTRIRVENMLKKYRTGQYGQSATRPLVDTRPPINPPWMSQSAYGSTPGGMDRVRAGTGGSGVDWGGGATEISPEQRNAYYAATGFMPGAQAAQHRVAFLSRGGDEAPIDPNNPGQVQGMDYSNSAINQSYAPVAPSAPQEGTYTTKYDIPADDVRVDPDTGQTQYYDVESHRWRDSMTASMGKAYGQEVYTPSAGEEAARQASMEAQAKQQQMNQAYLNQAALQANQQKFQAGQADLQRQAAARPTPPPDYTKDIANMVTKLITPDKNGIAPYTYDQALQIARSTYGAGGITNPGLISDQTLGIGYTAGQAPTSGVAEAPPVAGAQKAPDGKWYVRINGQWNLVG